ncbi:hypothetical protein JMJ58_05015 [Haloterrigena salifodinae]|uniref:Uncharacterized protein n=1 Tax=Haloterrigena salifodinae TaxID=2675099 RepID=A0A8T8E3U1_9EURY|nr:hypothetical protein [Haloterrigena salifodinae]QRV16257.1 hypothetical protein JMJ58_05015 [Haloterrigena salifodinae]
MKIGELAAIYTEAFALKAFGAVGLVFGVQLPLVYREYLGRHQYERFSPSMVAAIPCRIVLFWVAMTILLQLVVLALDPPVLQIVVLAVVFVSKLTVDWSLIRARHLDTSGSFSRWFVPNEPSPGE